eukprot:GHVS01012582.1.p1 GENE.GHVS01012582.1~~GHVS01012582.1.p1  ORF type:complete len:282 (-),score=70.89 GHVS01012582.1:328-1173(-)
MDLWEQDYQKATQLSSLISEQLHPVVEEEDGGGRTVKKKKKNKHEPKSQQKLGGGKETALLRGRIADLKQQISHLQLSLPVPPTGATASSAFTCQHRRQTLLKSLQDDTQSLYRQYEQRCLSLSASSSSASNYFPTQIGGGGGTAASGASSVGNPFPSSSSASVGNPFPASTAASLSHLSPAQLSDQQQQLVSSQDQQLDHLHGTVHNLKNIGYDISEEVTLHQRLLGDLEGQVDLGRGNVRQSESRLRQLMRGGRRRSAVLFCLVIALVVILILLIIYIS